MIKTNIVKDTRGMALVICLLIMTVAAMMGIGIATDSTIDGQISRNQRYTAKDFFIADGTNQVKLGEILTDNNLAPKIMNQPEIVQDESVESLSDLDNLPNPPQFKARINYLFRRHISAGFSIEDSGSFKFYYYTTKTNARRNNRDKTGIKTTEKKLGI
ncbi:MAG: pilus assembly PilX N-terminal domain-containing protein [Deltaproteobacteria bacterium]|nr:pilus assembly PilX N-terminal domain-containing protein [Candidatus Tharpella aukensis]